MSINFKIWPWDDENKKPYFISPEGIEWWVDENLTDWAQRKDTVNKSSKPLKAVCFIIRKDGNPIERVLIGEHQAVLAVDTNFEQMACKIDILRLA